MKTTTTKIEPIPIEQHIGLRLQRQRLKRGLSLEAVDELIGGKKGTTKAFEEGTRFVGPSDLFALSTALEVDVSFFFLGAGKRIKKPPPLARTPDVVEGARRLIQAYYDIQDHGLRRSVVDLLKELAEEESL